MNYYIYGPDFTLKKVLDNYISSIWTVRYDKYGDFEICIPYSKDIFDEIRLDDYIVRPDSDRMMIVEDIQIDTDAEGGNRIIFSGRSIESILDRRVLFDQTIVVGNTQDGIASLLNANAISPTDLKRKLPIVFRKSDDKTLTTLETAYQFSGESLYEAVNALCVEWSIGFRMVPDLAAGNFIFELYNGVDRSYYQTERPYVMFSPDFDNIITSSYVASKKEYKNVAYAAGEGEGSERTVIAVYKGDAEATGIARRETYVDAGSVSSTTEEGTLTEQDYLNQLASRGSEELDKVAPTTYFEGEVDTSRQFMHGIDFNIGDIVQLRNEYDIEGCARVTELVLSDDQNGPTAVPTFTSIEKEER